MTATDKAAYNSVHTERKHSLLPYKILPMDTEDLPEIIAIEKVSFKQPWSFELFERELANSISFSFVMRIDAGDGKLPLAAYVVFWIVADEAHILDFAVAPDLRGQGYGKEFLTFVLNFMDEERAETVRLEVRRSNQAAINLYRQFGFVQEYVRRNYYGDEDALVMMLELKNKNEFWMRYNGEGNGNNQ